MSCMFRHALCNEMYGEKPFAEMCRSARKLGYLGVEIAPFTLAQDANQLPAARRRELKDILQAEGLTCPGLHWLLLGPPDLHVSTADKAVWRRSWNHVRGLVDLCADLGGKVMVFGSPKQRSAPPGMSPAEARANFVEGLAGVAPHAAERGVAILLEALAPDQTNVITCLDEAAEMVRQIDSPGVKTMFDTHNAVAEKEPHPVLVERHFDLIRHIHVNEMDGRYPGSGSYDFKAVLAVLRRRGYSGWISLEVFDFKPGPEEIAGASINYLRNEEKKLAL